MLQQIADQFREEHEVHYIKFCDKIDGVKDLLQVRKEKPQLVSKYHNKSTNIACSASIDAVRSKIVQRVLKDRVRIHDAFLD